MKKKEKLESIIKYGILTYIMGCVLYGFVGRIIPLYMFVGELINGYIFICFALIGSALVFLDFIVFRKMFKGKYCWILYGFVFVMFISSILNYKYGISDNIKTIIWTVIQISLFYCAYLHWDKKSMLKFVKIAFDIIVWIWNIAVSYSLVQFIQMKAYGVEISKDVWKRQGFRDNRLFGIFNDPNYAAVTSVYVIFMMIFLIRKTDVKWKKALYIIMSIIQGIYIVLAGSRTAKLCIYIVGFLYVFFVMKNVCIKYYKEWKSICIRGLLSLGVVLAIFTTGELIEKGMPHLPKIYANHVLNEKENEISEQQKAVAEWVDRTEQETFLERQDVQAGGTTNTRLVIWSNYIQGVKGRYIIGTSPRNVEEYMEDVHPEIYEINNRYETHNGYLSVFVGTGIIGLSIIILFAVLIGIKVCKYLFSKSEIDNDFVNIFVIELIILIYTFFFTELFFVNNLTTVIFWSLLGVMMYWIGDQKRT